MKQLLTFIRKEFYHVLRDRRVLLMLFGLPIVQVILFGFALSNEIKNTGIAVFDQDKSALSSELIYKIDANKYFDIDRNLTNPNQFQEAFKDGKVKIVLVIPSDFSENLSLQKKANLQMIVDGTDINLGNQISNYLQNIIVDFYKNQSKNSTQSYNVTPEIRMLYNPQLKGAPNFVPGVMALILLIVCVMMTAIAIVKEKETGTMEILLVSPMKPSFVIIAKAVPYFILSMMILLVILILSYFLLDLPIKGSIILLFFVSTIFILTNLLIGILISIFVKTQQQAMLISLIATMLPTLMLSGFMFPIENMPFPLQIISNIIPAKWYYIMIKNIMIKGTGIAIIWKPFLILLGMMMILFIIAVKKFKIRLE
ncbi:ABC transporter permease [Cloacibacterium sp.]|uniref:ABC transporter permease n=1 Tax=Cloacibacterium sp. TaxID=1913682 RepID=UPI0039E40CE5